MTRAADRRDQGILSKIIEKGELPFRELMEVALYDPEAGYYARGESPIGPRGDYVTAPAISPVFAFTLARVVREVLDRSGDDLCTVVDIGCGDGRLLREIDHYFDSEPRLEYLGVDRCQRENATGDGRIPIAPTVDAIPRDRTLVVLANELYDAFPFARLVCRAGRWNELWVRAAGDALEWAEHPATPAHVAYLDAAGVDFRDGQFVDIALEWKSFHHDLCGRIGRGLVAVFDYGFRTAKLFDARIRRFGTAASYRGHRVHRDLLRDPGRQDLTAHINFDDLEAAGVDAGLETLVFLRQAEFLLRAGAGEHPLLRAIEPDAGSGDDLLALREDREAARRLVLPEGIGEEISVLIQQRGLPGSGWSFQRALW